MNLSTEQILQDLSIRIERMQSCLNVLLSERSSDWVSKQVFMAITGWDSRTINNYVSQRKIRKKGNLYSLKSYSQYCEVYDRRACEGQ